MGPHDAAAFLGLVQVTSDGRLQVAEARVHRRHHMWRNANMEEGVHQMETIKLFGKWLREEFAAKQAARFKDESGVFE